MAVQHRIVRVIQSFLDSEVRPIGMVLITCWYVGLALFSIVVTASILVPIWQSPASLAPFDVLWPDHPVQRPVSASPYDPVPWVERFGPALFVVLVLATIFVAIGIGMWRYHPLTYWIVVSTNAWIVGARLVTYRSWTVRSVITTVVAAGIIWYLIRPRMRAFYWYHAKRRRGWYVE